ncbi:hypothetical protein M2277_006523, partial [Paenibacillus sp. LBL]|nr:hypothetical protein [Paenibacillus sp. LBL]
KESKERRNSGLPSQTSTIRQNTCRSVLILVRVEARPMKYL